MRVLCIALFFATITTTQSQTPATRLEVGRLTDKYNAFKEEFGLLESEGKIDLEEEGKLEDQLGFIVRDICVVTSRIPWTVTTDQDIQDLRSLVRKAEDSRKELFNIKKKILKQKPARLNIARLFFAKNKLF